MKELLNSTFCKCLSTSESINDVSDEEVFDLFKYCALMIEDRFAFDEVMKNVHGNRYDENQTIPEFFVTFHKMMNNEVKKRLEKYDLSIDDIPDFRYKLGRKLLCIAKCIELGILTTAKSRDILDDMLEPVWIGVEMEDYIIHSGKFEDVDNSALIVNVKTVLANNEKIVAEYKSGKDKVIGSLIGQVMRIEKFEPDLVKATIIEEISKM